MIYAIQADGTKFVKIGITGSETAYERLKAMQVGCPHKLVLLASVDWPDHLELKIHRHLANDYERGEWFRLGAATMTMIEVMQMGQRGLPTLYSMLLSPNIPLSHRLGRVLAHAKALTKHQYATQVIDWYGVELTNK